MKKPNFFLIGAPKSATTALAHHLSLHPAVFFSVPKETNYFAIDINRPLYSNLPINLEQFLKLYEDANSQHLAIGESSVLNLYSKVAVSNILSFNENAKFIVILRNPIEAVCSYFYHVRRKGYEHIKSFKKEWDAQKERKQGRKISYLCRDDKLLYYGDIFQYGSQLESLFKLVSKRQVCVILYDDLIGNFRHEYLR